MDVERPLVTGSEWILTAVTAHPSENAAIQSTIAAGRGSWEPLRAMGGLELRRCGLGPEVAQAFSARRKLLPGRPVARKRASRTVLSDLSLHQQKKRSVGEVDGFNHTNQAMDQNGPAACQGQGEPIYAEPALEPRAIANSSAA